MLFYFYLYPAQLHGHRMTCADVLRQVTCAASCEKQVGHDSFFAILRPAAVCHQIAITYLVVCWVPVVVLVYREWLLSRSGHDHTLGGQLWSMT